MNVRAQSESSFSKTEQCPSLTTILRNGFMVSQKNLVGGKKILNVGFQVWL